MKSRHRLPTLERRSDINVYGEEPDRCQNPQEKFCSLIAGSPAAILGKIGPRPLSDEALSSGNIDLIQGWICKCTQEHKYCNTNIEVELPSRVIDVGREDGSESPHLVITHGTIGRYVALSHRWGKPTAENPHFKTESHNIQERMAGIISERYEGPLMFIIRRIREY